MDKQFTPEQIVDIKSREERAQAYLKDNDLILSAAVYSVNIGDSTFAQKVTPYLQDTKFSKKNDTTN